MLYSKLFQHKLLKDQVTLKRWYLQAVPGLKSNALYKNHKVSGSNSLQWNQQHKCLRAVTPNTGGIFSTQQFTLCKCTQSFKTRGTCRILFFISICNITAAQLCQQRKPNREVHNMLHTNIVTRYHRFTTHLLRAVS